jgi:hypothetical protein
MQFSSDEVKNKYTKIITLSSLSLSLSLSSLSLERTCMQIFIEHSNSGFQFRV